MTTRKIQKIVSYNFRLPSDKSEIKKRIKEAVRLAGGPKEVAAITNIPLTTLQSYTTGGSEPKLTVAATIASACNVSLNWLVYGEGPTDTAEFTGWVEGEAHPTMQIAMAVYDMVYESGHLVTLDIFEELIVRFYELHKELGDLDEVSDDNEKWRKLKRLMAVALRQDKK